MTEINAVLIEAYNELKTQSESARLDAEILLAHVLKKNRSYLYSHPELELSSEHNKAFKELIKKRVKGIPIAYLTGLREFWSLPLKVCEDTLIPRPETELLVELTLKFLADKPKAQILDLGTGSGAIALALAVEKPNWQITATDLCPAALEVAKNNTTLLGIGNINFHLSSWFDNLPPDQKFDAIITNPPYIAEHDPHLEQGDLRFEPKLALISGADGLTAIRHIIKNSLERLNPNGLLLIEHGFEQKLEIGSMLINYGYGQVHCWQDWQNLDRVSGGRMLKK